MAIYKSLGQNLKNKKTCLPSILTVEQSKLPLVPDEGLVSKNLDLEVYLSESIWVFVLYMSLYESEVSQVNVRHKYQT